MRKVGTCDRRIGKTEQAIIQALEELMGEKNYMQITVQEIIDKANVGRTTFYAHFPTKDDLLKRCIERNLEILREGLNHLETSEQNASMISVTNILNHIKAHKRLIKGLMNSEASDILFNRCKEYLRELILQHLEARQIQEKDLKIPLEIILTHIVGSLFAVVKWWMDTGMKIEPKEMENYWISMILPILKIMN